MPKSKAVPRRAPARRAKAPGKPVKAAKKGAGLVGTTPAGGEVRAGAEPMGTTPGGGHVRSGPSTVGSTPGGGEVHHVTTRKSGEKPAGSGAAAKAKAESEAEEAPEGEEDEEEEEAAAELEELEELEEELAEPSVTDGRAHRLEPEQAEEAGEPEEVTGEEARAPAPPGPGAGVTAVTSLVATAKTSFHLAKVVASQALSSERLGRAFRMASGLGAAVRTSLGIGGGAKVDEYGKDAGLTEQLQPLTDFLYDRYWRVSVAGADLVPAGGVMLVANHSGAVPVDGPVVHQALRRERPDLKEARWLVEDQVFHAPFVGTLFNRIGAVRACPENAQRLLEEGRPVIVFPEGIQGIGKPFQQRYQLKRLGRGGFAKLAVRARVPIVPVAVVGAEEALPLLAKLPTRFLGMPYLPITLPPLPTKWTIRFGEPIQTSALDPAASEDPAAVQPLVEQTRGAIEGMLRALLDERRSVFRG